MSRKRNKLGDCFKSAFNMMCNLSNDAQLVHGMVMGNSRHIHAWVEINNFVFDFSNGNKVCMLREKYYDIGKIDNTKKYDMKTALLLSIKHGHYGPWE